MSRKRLSGRVLIAVASLLGILSLLPAKAIAGQECIKIQRWLKEHEGALPRSFDEISKYPLAYRRAIFGTLSPEEKSEAWRAHLNRFLEIRSELTPDQRDVVLRAYDLVSPEFYSLPKQEELWQELFGGPLAKLQKRAQKVFDAESLKTIFTELGGVVEQGGVFSSLVAAAGCECSTVSDYCDAWGPESKTCKIPAEACKVSGGCGSGWGYTCDGQCYPNSEPATLTQINQQ